MSNKKKKTEWYYEVIIYSKFQDDEHRVYQVVEEKFTGGSDRENRRKIIEKYHSQGKFIKSIEEATADA